MTGARTIRKQDNEDHIKVFPERKSEQSVKDIRTSAKTETEYTQSLLITEQDSQCTYNLTLKRVHVTNVAVEKQRVLHILSVCL